MVQSHMEAIKRDVQTPDKLPSFGKSLKALVCFMSCKENVNPGIQLTFALWLHAVNHNMAGYS